MTFDDVVLYPNQFITVTPKGYTKHYFAGTQRIATAIGGGGFCNMVTPTDNMTSYERDKQQNIIVRLYTYLTDQQENHTKNEDISHVPLPELQYGDARQTLYNINCDFKTESLCSLLEYLCHKQKDDEVFYYHPDHLGGAAWITDMSGKPVQYLHYAPYGEMVANQMPYGIDERFKFTGKERDAETGYDNFEARPYLSAFSIFGKVDPLTDKYIGTQPYLYCNGNPIRYIDPDGREITITGEDGITVTYIPGGKYEGNDSFTNETYTKLNQLNDMFSNTDFMPSIVNSSNIYNISSDESMVGGTHSFKNGVINIGTTCSIDGLGHELFHAYQDTKRQGGASIHNEVEAYLFQTKILFTLYQGSGSTPLTAAEKQSSSTYSNALNTLLFDGFNQNAFNAVVSEFKTASNANNLKVYDNYPLIRSNQMQSLIKHFYPIYP